MRMRLGAPYRCTKFEYDRLRIRSLGAKKLMKKTVKFGFSRFARFLGPPRPHTPHDRGFLYSLRVCTKFLTNLENLADVSLPVPEI